MREVGGEMGWRGEELWKGVGEGRWGEMEGSRPGFKFRIFSFLTCQMGPELERLQRSKVTK